MQKFSFEYGKFHLPVNYGIVQLWCDAVKPENLLFVILSSAVSFVSRIVAS